MACSPIVLFLLPLFFTSAFSQWPFFPGQDLGQDTTPDTGFLTGFLGSWELVTENSGVSAMHMQLMPGTSKVVVFDSTSSGPSKIELPNGKCRYDPHNKTTHEDCWAHSVEYDYDTGNVRALMVLTDTWCSSGSLSPDGRLIQTGGFYDGGRKVRTYDGCDTCDWKELSSKLTGQRWYASNHILPDGRIIVVGGRRKFDYEFVPMAGQNNAEAFELPFLRETTDRVENNLYPFVFLSTDGNLFVFANNQSILLDYQINRVVKTFPILPGGSRNYPASGSAVLLPLKLTAGDENLVPAEVLVCGGAEPRSPIMAAKGVFLPALATCGRITITDPNPVWQIETMPSKRVMGDMLILPNTDVLIINGAKSGSSGWEFAQDPNLEPVLYRADNPFGSRFQTLNSASIPRMYHSTTAVLPDGRVLVAGSNSHNRYNFTSQYPTELRIEKFWPPYLDPLRSFQRPRISDDTTTNPMQYGQAFTVRVSLEDLFSQATDFRVTMYSSPFTTHSFSQNQRMLVLQIQNVVEVQPLNYQLTIAAPANNILAPPGYYMIFVMYWDLPSTGMWVQIQ